jgi:transcriptional regulator with XRE-family HTH domain
MNEPESNPSAALATKITRLVEERGWNQEEFARIANLNRQTVRQIMLGGSRTLRNSTISACAKALGLSVSELRDLALERLLPRMHNQTTTPENDPVKSLLEQATQPELIAWIQRNPDRARQLDPDELDELLSLQQESGGPFVNVGVEHFVQIIERKRQLFEQVHTIAGTEYLDLLEKLVDLIYEKVQPYRDKM